MTGTRKLLLAILTVCLVVLLVRNYFYFNTIRVIVAKDHLYAPEFTDIRATSWINSEPLSFAKLKGKVVLLFLWTFD